MSTPRRAIRGVLDSVDAVYRRMKRLRPVGTMLLVGTGTYRGPARCLADGTRLAHGQRIGVLHFNNQGFRHLHAATAQAAAFSFSRALRRSLRALADLQRNDPAWREISAFHAVSWLPAHGSAVGFQTEPLPEGIGKTLRSAYFRLLVWTFAAAEEGPVATISPHEYWLTGKALRRHHAMKDVKTRGPR